MSAGFPGGNQMAKPGGAEFNEPVGYGGMTPGDALGGGLTMIDPLTGLPRGAMPQGPLPGDMLGQPVDTPRVTDPFNRGGGPKINYPGQTFGPSDLSTPGPQQQPQQFPNLMQNPAFNPGIQPPQQMQQIAQGQPTLVNQLSPPPASGPVPGSSITQQPQPFPQTMQAPIANLVPPPAPQLGMGVNPPAPQPAPVPAPAPAPVPQPQPAPAPTLNDRVAQALQQSQAAKAQTVATRPPPQLQIAPRPVPKPAPKPAPKPPPQLRIGLPVTGLRPPAARKR